MFKRFFYFLSLFFVLIHPVFAQNFPFNKIVFFGDSLSDNGNLYRLYAHYIPKVPYYDGRFSNGPVWSEYVSNYLNLRKITAENYAYGGEAVEVQNPSDHHMLILPTLNATINYYYLTHLFSDRKNVLYVIFIGANDYLDGAGDVGQPPAVDPVVFADGIVNQIKSEVLKIQQFGGQNIMLVNLPNLAQTPYATAYQKEAFLGESSTEHNQKLAEVVKDLQRPGLNIQLFDLNALFQNYLINPSKENAIYHVNIDDTTNACWGGGYTIQAENVNGLKVANNMNAYLNQNHLFIAKDDMVPQKTEDAANFIAGNASLREAYVVSEKAAANIQPCTAPEQYFFWDHLHPTTLVHEIIAENVIDFINQHYLSNK